MAETEGPDTEQVADEQAEYENSSGDSGIQISQQDEDPECEEKTQDSNTEQDPEDSITPNPSEEDDSTTTPSEENKAMIKSPEKEKAEMEEMAEEEKNEPKDSHNNLVTVELTVNENDRNSPEIVVEPKFVERLPSGKHTPQNFRVVTPKYSLLQERKSTPPTSRVTKKHSFCKKFKRCVLLVIFTAIVVGYAIGGAYLFSYLERKREIEYNAKIDKWKNDTAILLATELRQVMPYEDVWARKVFHYLEVFEKDLLKASSVGYRRQDDKDREQRWTWTSSLFFSITLMTTTGYGPMTPRSKLGRIATLFYSMFGIPLAFSWFMIIGYALATFWASLFQNVCCRLCHEDPPENLQDILPNPKHKEALKLPKLRSNSIVPLEEQKLIVRTDSNARHSAKVRQTIFPGNSRNKCLNKSNNYPNPTTENFHSSVRSMRQLEIEFEKMKKVYHKMDYVMAIIYASMLFIVYYIFFSILFALYEGWVLTDILYFSYLMFVTVGPGCHELADDGAEIKIKNDLFYTIHLCIGYCILAMIVNLIYMLLREKSDSEIDQKWEVFDSFHREKF